MADRQFVDNCVRSRKSFERISRWCICAIALAMPAFQMGCTGSKRVAWGPTWPWQQAAESDRKPSPFREPKTSETAAEQFAKRDNVNQYGFDRETWEFVQGELEDAAPSERDEMLEYLKDLDPAMVRVALRTRRLSKNATDSHAKSSMQVAARQDDFDDGHRFRPPPARDFARSPRDRHRGQVRHVGAVIDRQQQVAAVEDLPSPSATLTGVQQSPYGALSRGVFPAQAALERQRLEQSAHLNPAQPHVSSRDAWPHGSAAGTGSNHQQPAQFPPTQSQRLQSQQSQTGQPSSPQQHAEHQSRVDVGFGVLSPNIPLYNPPYSDPSLNNLAGNAQTPPRFTGQLNQTGPIAQPNPHAMPHGVSPNGLVVGGGQMQQPAFNTNRVHTAAAFVDQNSEPWQQELGRMIAQLEASTSAPQVGVDQLSAQQRELMVRKHLYLRMLYVMSGQGTQALATSQIPHIDDKEREFWRQLFWAMHQYFDSQTLPNRSDRITQTLNQLRYAVQELQPRAHLELRNVNFCNSIASFGNFESFPRNEFPAGEEVLIYAEVVNFTSEIAGERFHSRLQPTIEIYQAGNDQTPVKSMEYAATPDYCSNPRQDFYLSIKLAIPKGLAQGPHVLKLIVKDVLGNKAATYPLRFTVR